MCRPLIKLSLFIGLLKIDFKTGNIVHSKVKNNSEVIADFKKGKYEFLVTTTVLERGVTIKGLQVIIYGADHAVYDSSSLIQIAGRVGRKKEESDGEVVFIVSRENQAIKESIRDIKEKKHLLANCVTRGKRRHCLMFIQKRQFAKSVMKNLMYSFGSKRRITFEILSL